MNWSTGLILLVALFFTGDCKPRIPWWQIQVAKSQGPNACIVEEVAELNKKYYTECKYWPVRKVCGRETIVRYECCEGYKQIPGGEGCTGVKALKNVLETARDLGASKFVEYLEQSGIANDLSQEGTFTLFAPTDQAFEANSGMIVGMKIESFMTPNGDNPILRYHISDRKYPSKNFAGNNEIQSQYEGRKLRVSKYSTGMETVNCVLISRKDQEATNGIVHIIDHPLDPTLFIPADVARVVIEDGRFTRLADAFNRCNFLPRLRESGITYTLLAPSDEAFLKIPPARLEKMLSDPASCTALLENHVVPHVMCLPVITEEYKARSVGPERLGFSCDEKGHSVESKRLGGEFILGDNGVVYMLDDVLIPDRARTLVELLDSKQLFTFAQLVRVAGLEVTLSNAGDYTLFAPTEAALYTLDEELLDEAKRNPELARKIVLYHGAQGRTRLNEIRNNQILQCIDDENTLRMLVYRKQYGVEDAIIESGDIEGYNGVLHIINKVIFPATQSAGDLLRKSQNYSMFLEAMETILQNEPEGIDLSRGSAAAAHYTFFVPTDDAFQRLGQAQLRRLQSDQSYLTKVIKNHVSSQMMSSEAFRPDLVYETPTAQNTLSVTCDRQRAMRVNNANVLQKDLVSANGIIHVIDRILLPENGQAETPSGGTAAASSRRSSTAGRSSSASSSSGGASGSSISSEYSGGGSSVNGRSSGRASSVQGGSSGGASSVHGGSSDGASSIHDGSLGGASSVHRGSSGGVSSVHGGSSDGASSVHGGSSGGASSAYGASSSGGSSISEGSSGGSSSGSGGGYVVSGYRSTSYSSHSSSSSTNGHRASSNGYGNGNGNGAANGYNGRRTSSVHVTTSNGGVNGRHISNGNSNGNSNGYSNGHHDTAHINGNAGGHGSAHVVHGSEHHETAPIVDSNGVEEGYNSEEQDEYDYEPEVQ